MKIFRKICEKISCYSKRRSFEVLWARENNKMRKITIYNINKDLLS